MVVRLALTLARFPYFATFASGGRGWRASVWKLIFRKLSVEALRNKDHSRSFNEYSRLLYSFFLSYVNIWPVMAGQMSKFGDFPWNIRFSSFSTSIPDIVETMKHKDMVLSPACSTVNSLQDDCFILKHRRRYCHPISHGKPTGHVCRPAAAATTSGSFLLLVLLWKCCFDVSNTH